MPQAVHRARVVGRSALSAHLVRISVALDADDAFATTQVPDEYLRVLIAPAGSPLVLPTISDTWEFSVPEGAAMPVSRVYTVSDYRLNDDGGAHIDLDIALHDAGPGAAWARECRPGDEVGLMDPHGLYAAPADVGWQLLVADITGIPAMARILRGLAPGQRVRAVGVLTDPADVIELPSAAEVDVQWVVVERELDLSPALERAVLDTSLPATDRYVWFAGEARASRSVRRHLRRTLGWSQSDFYTCGYWQIEAEKWNARYEEVAEEVRAQAIAAHERAAGDEGTYLDALDDIYESAGL